MKECFIPKNFSASTLAIIEQADAIIEDYATQGYALTLRQLYYQFVSKALIPNTERSYKRLGSIINDARLAGMIDWDAIEDRGRNVQRIATFDSPSEGIDALRQQYRINMWRNQPTQVEVWIEKEALIGVIADKCRQYGVPYFACKGYVSQSEMWRGGRRAYHNIIAGKHTVILHLGDHDPSGIDMTRDNEERLRLFSGHAGDAVDVERLALNYDQVEHYAPPPNPTKLSDSRAGQYIRDYGHSSWELDALEPAVINVLIENAIQQHIDYDIWAGDIERQNADVHRLDQIIDELGE